MYEEVVMPLQIWRAIAVIGRSASLHCNLVGLESDHPACILDAFWGDLKHAMRIPKRHVISYVPAAPDCVGTPWLRRFWTVMRFFTGSYPQVYESIIGLPVFSAICKAAASETAE